METEAVSAGWRSRAEPEATTVVCVELPPWSGQWRTPPLREGLKRATPPLREYQRTLSLQEGLRSPGES